MPYTLNRQTQETPSYPAYMALVGPTIIDRSGTVTPTVSGPTRYAAGKLAGYRNPTLFDLNPNNFTFDDRAALNNALTVSGPQRLAVGRNSRINYHKNPSAETSAGWGGYFSGTVTRVPSNIGTGLWGVEITSNGTVNSGGFSNLFDNLPTGIYTISLYVKHVSGSRSWALRATPYNVTATTSGSTVIQTFTAETNNWTRVSLTIDTSAFADFHYFYLYIMEQSGVVGTVQIDNILVERSSVLGTYFDGSFTNCGWFNPQTGVVGTAHASASISNPAIYTEEATTNLVPDPSLEGAGTGTTWGSSTRTKVTTHALFGVSSVQVVTTVAGGTGGVNANSGGGLNYTGSARTFIGSGYVRGTPGVTVAVSTRAYYTDTSSDVVGANNYVLTNSWQRVVGQSVTLNPAKTLSTLWFIVTTTTPVDATFYVDGCQIEEKAYCTSYTDGSLGTGYSWGGTAHASSSTRALGAIQPIANGRVTTKRGSLSAWIKTDLLRSSLGVLSIGSYGTEDYLSLTLLSDGRVTLGSKTGSQTDQSLNTTATLAAAQWSFLYADWTETQLRIQVNNTAPVALTRTAPSGNLASNSEFRITFLNSSTTLNGSVESLSTFDQPLTSADITNLYTKTEPWSMTSLKSFTGEVYEAEPRFNYVPNPRAANDRTSWIDTSGGVASRVTGDGVSGSTCIELTTSGLNMGVTMHVGDGVIKNGKPYTISFYAKVMSGTTAWYLNTRTYDVTSYIGDSGSLQFTATSTWKRYTFSIVPNATGLHKIRLYWAQNSAGSGVLRITDVQFEDGYGATPYFDGSFPNAAWIDPRTYVQGTAHASPSVSHAAPFIEEGTTNYITNPSFETNITDWNALGAATLSRDTTYAAIGSACLKIVTPNVATGEGAYFSISRIAASNGQNWTGQIRVRGTGTWLFRVAEYDSTPTFLAQSVTSTITATDQWQTISLSRTFNQATTAWATILISTPTQQSATLYVDCVQLEQKAYATTYCDGSLGTGYSWSGTAHASSSTRLSTGETVPVTNHLLPTKGSVALWMQIPTLGIAGAAFTMQASDAGRVYLGREANNQLYVRVGQSATTFLGVNSFSVGQWVHMVLTWDGTTLNAYVNGALSGTNAYTGLLLADQAINIGSYGNINSWLNGAVDGIQTFDRVITQSEITALYNSRNPRSMKSLNSYKPRLSRSKLDLVLQRQPKVSTTSVLFHYGGNGLSGRDRVGSVAGTASGAMRYQPFNGARINLVKNPRFANDTSGWFVNAGTFSRVVDSKFSGGTAVEVALTASTAACLQLDVTGSSLWTGGAVTISFDAYLVSGATDFTLIGKGASAAGTDLEGPTAGTFTLTTKPTRYVITYTPGQSASGVHYLRSQFRRLSAVSSTFRMSNVVIEYGTVSNPKYFDGSTGMWLDPITGIVGTSHASPSVSHAVPWIEEGTTNVITNPSAEVDTSLWSGSSSVLTRDTTYARNGSASFKNVTTSTGGGMQTGGTVIAAANGQTWTISGYFRGSGDLVRFEIVERDSGGGGLSTNASTFTTAIDAWVRFTYTVTLSNASTAYIQPRVVSSLSGVTFYTDSIQLEQKAYATSYCDGSLGTGYSWSGTANASSSVRTTASFKFDETNHISSTKGSLITWVNRQIDTGARAGVLYVGEQASGKDLFANYIESADQPTTDWRISGGGAQTVIFTPNNVVNVWELWYVEWDNTNIAMSVNAIAKKYGTRSAPTTLDSATYDLMLGKSNVAGSELNGFIGPTIIFDRPLSQSEISAYYSNPSTYGWNKASASNVNIARSTSPLTLIRSNKVTTTPSLLHLVGNSLTGTDRNGSVAVTSSGAFRVQPAKGARTNFAPDPQLKDTTKFGAPGFGSIAVISNDLPNVSGITSAYRASVTTIASTPYIEQKWTSAPRYLSNIASVGGQQLTFSVYVKVPGGRRVMLDPLYLTADGAFLSEMVAFVTTTGQWQRMSCTFTPPAGTHNIALRIRLDNTAGYNLTVGDIMLTTGWQLEVGSSASSYFDGSFAGAAWADPTTGILGTSHASPSFSQAAYWVEEGTTNLVANPSCEVDTVGWNSVTGVISRSTAMAYNGVASIANTRNAAPGYLVTYYSPSPAITVTAGLSYTLSCRVRSSVSMPNVRVAIEFRDGSNVTTGSALASLITSGDSWTYSGVTGVAPTNSVKALVVIQQESGGTVGDVLYVDSVQLEQKAYATSYCDGALGSGYSWSGTAHASTSTRAATSITTVEDNHINANTGSALVWFKRDSDTGSFQRVLMVGAQLAGTDYLTLRVGTGDQLEQLMVTGTSANIYSAASVAQAPVGVWHMAYIEWTSTAFGVSLNNATLVTSAKEAPNGTFVSPSYDLGIGVNNLTSIQQINGVIGPLMIFDRPLTTSERTGFYSNPSRYGFNTLISAPSTQLIRQVL